MKHTGGPRVKSKAISSKKKGGQRQDRHGNDELGSHLISQTVSTTVRQASHPSW